MTAASPFRAAVLVLVLALLPACAARTPPDPSAVPPAAESAPPLRFNAQKVLVLPVQSAAGLPPAARGRLDAELLFALAERDARTPWIAPEELERALRRSPGFAASPHALPADRLRHHGERRVVDPLAGELRRYAALMDVRLVLLPHAAAWVPAEGGGEVRISGVVVDARSGDVIWWGEAAGERRAEADAYAVASAAAAFAARVATAPEG